MFIDKLMNQFGYSEMYEWSELFKFDIVPYGRFVTFDSNEHGKIRLANTGDNPIGVTTINTVCTSDNPEEWQGKYLCNEYGDCLLQEKDIAIAQEHYDDVKEIPYIATIKDTKIVPIINDEYDPSKEYVRRSERSEWVRVNLIGKCIVVDNGKCQPGQWCTIGENGIAVPTEIISKIPSINWYVIDRLTDNTIMIFFK